MKAGLLAGRQTAGGFSPDDIPDCVKWLDSADTATITNAAGAVTTWNDKSGEGNNQTVNYNGTPTSGSRTLNGLNAIDFDGDDITGPSVVGDPKTTGVSIFAVVYMDDSHVGTVYAEGRNDTNNDCLVLGTRPLPYFAIRSGNSTFQVDMSASTSIIGGTHLLAVTVAAAGGAVVIRVDGTTENSVGSYSLPGSLVVNVGSVGYMVRAADQYPFDGAVAELVVYDRALNSTERDQVEEYLADKWGVTI